MKNLIKLIGTSLFLALALVSCEKEDSLQKFLVDTQEKDGYLSTSVPKGIVGFKMDNMSEDSQKAYESINKINLVALPKDAKKVNFEEERERLDKILKSDSYKTLMRHSSDDMKVHLVYEGEKDAIDEVLVYADMPKVGMGLARITGDNMNLNDIMKMMKELENSDLDEQKVKNMLEGFGIKTDSDNNIDEDSIKEALENSGINIQ
ncbi:MAG: DUF4252 domain-containing protein [Bacteroidota bacterium]|uniref:DUF4252 domain-containing protein n=1 Tax=Nonlabens tegetincola TaxID=323273 RepID=UPI000A202DD2|nr:DUF4252 domain-containing protein [Nonlabens tegetincola]ARN70720.1 hypothetical protein BST91_03185 [Nonlabens tegetincola]MEE2802441.1 DUF4252 domain-containing protein [Bacteroidota bacterium]